MERHLHGVLAALAALAIASVDAAPVGPGPVENAGARVQNGDPYVPPASRMPSAQPAASGDALRAQVLQKLQSDFEKADVDHAGSVTLTQANRAGLGLVARHFDKIDTKHAGRVSFDQVREYLRSQGAQL
jgi:hypothetical protein